ncbi:MAG: hypothetical protein ACI4S4_07450 [Candidatus Ornithospirochaeta sp.]
MDSYTISEIESAISRASNNRNIVMTNEMLTSSITKKDDFAAAFPYDYGASREKILFYDAFIRKARHAIHSFSVSHFVDEYDMTLDEFYMYCSDLDRKSSKLHRFANERPMTRGIVNSHVEYSYINFDMAEMKKEYEAVCGECKKAQAVRRYIEENIKFSDPSFVLDEMPEEEAVAPNQYYDEESGMVVAMDDFDDFPLW